MLPRFRSFLAMRHLRDPYPCLARLLKRAGTLASSGKPEQWSHGCTGQTYLACTTLALALQIISLVGIAQVRRRSPRIDTFL